jgi:hypothetical protein
MIQTEREFEVSKMKLDALKKQYERAKTRPIEDEQARAFSLKSLRSMMNQLEEEMTRYKAHSKAGV